MDTEHHKGEKVKILSSFMYRAELLLLRTIMLAIRGLPRSMVAYLGRAIAMTAWMCMPMHRKSSDIQIRYALVPGNEKQITRRVFMNQVDLIIDMVRYARMDDMELKDNFIIEGKEHLDSCLSSGRGVMIVAGHMNWEVLVHVARLLGVELSIMADIIKNQAIQTVIEELRSRCRLKILPPKGGMIKKHLDELSKALTVAIVIDQRGKRENRLFCNVFGMPAPTNPAPAFIALKGDALVLPVYAVKEGQKYRVRFERFLDTRTFGDDYRSIDKIGDCWRSQAVRDLSDALQSWWCSVIKEYPEQWFWLHCRWVRRADMKKIMKKRMDFREFVHAQAEKHLSENNIT